MSSSVLAAPVLPRLRTLQPGETVAPDVPPGEQLVDCVSVSPPGLKARRIVTVEAGRQAVVALSLAAQQGPGSAQAQPATRFRPLAPDVVVDAVSGLQWRRTGVYDLRWTPAESHCRSLGDGWSLPTVQQLQSLVDTGLPGIPCGSVSCKVSDVFSLRGFECWSSERAEKIDHAWSVRLQDGTRVQREDWKRSGTHALCARRP